MANAIYPNFKQALLDGSANTDMSGANVKVLLIDTTTDPYDANNTFHSDLAGAGIIATSPNLSSKTFTDGLFDAADFSFTGVSGNESEALIIYIDTGVSSTSRLVAFMDTGVTGLPVTPNGGDINIEWNASGIFQL